jgi:uncharacterized damage-inducible protein DinB
MVEYIEDPRRPDPPLAAPEREMLEAWLEFHRTTLLIKCEGLSDDDRTRRPVATSLMSLHGLVRHMADVERSWFQRTLRSSLEPVPLFWSREQPEGDWEGAVGADWEADLATWQAECETSRRIAGDHSLDDVGEARDGRRVSLRWIYVHMIEEYARHNGHADLIREMVDGSVGD